MILRAESPAHGGAVIAHEEGRAVLLYYAMPGELVEAEPFRFDDKVLPVTISLGVAAAGGAEPVTAEALLRLADERLYEAKRGGRNRVAG